MARDWSAGLLVNAIACELRHDASRAAQDAQHFWQAPPSQCPKHYAHHFLIDNGTMTCKYCGEVRPSPVVPLIPRVRSSGGFR